MKIDNKWASWTHEISYLDKNMTSWHYYSSFLNSWNKGRLYKESSVGGDVSIDGPKGKCTIGRIRLDLSGSEGSFLSRRHFVQIISTHCLGANLIFQHMTYDVWCCLFSTAIGRHSIVLLSFICCVAVVYALQLTPKAKVLHGWWPSVPPCPPGHLG